MLSSSNRFFGFASSYREVYRIAWEQVGAHEAILRPWIGERQEVAKTIETRLPKGAVLTLVQRRIRYASPFARIVVVGAIMNMAAHVAHVCSFMNAHDIFVMYESDSSAVVECRSLPV